MLKFRIVSVNAVEKVKKDEERSNNGQPVDAANDECQSPSKVSDSLNESQDAANETILESPE